MGAIALHHEITGREIAGMDSTGVEGSADTQRPAILLLNALGATLSIWERQVPALAEHFVVVRCDMRGHGESPVPPGPYVLDDLVDDCIALLDNLGIQRVHLAGLSLGGMTAMRMAARNPERVDRLAVLSSSAQLGSAQTWTERAATVRTSGTEAVADTVVSRWLTEQRRLADPQTTAALREMVASTAPDGYANCCEAIRDTDLRADLALITAPTLVISGTDDQSTPPEHLQAVAAGIQGARLLEIPDCAHICTIDQPDVVTDALVEHFSGAAPDRG